MADNNSAEKPAGKTDPAAQALNLVVARALWRAEVKPAVNKLGADERKANWTENRSKYAQQARALIRTLKAEGVSLSVTEKSTKAKK